MSKCKYCGNDSGWFSSSHKDCEDKFKFGIEKINTQINNFFNGSGFINNLDRAIRESIENSFLSVDESRKLLASGWEQAVELFLEDGVLDNSEESLLSDYKNKFNLTQQELDQKGSLTKTTRALVLRDLVNGIVPIRVNYSENLPINLQKKETLIWVFNSCNYLEDKTKKQYVGKTNGVSVRIAKGVYYRTSGFKGQQVEYTERLKIDKGLVAITDKHIYFAGPLKSTRIPYSKIISFIPFSDGFGILSDSSTAKPQIFVTGDGWFSYNLVTNAAKMQDS